MSERETTTLQTRCCIVGGGPAGIMLALLLARAGVAVTVLEKHGDFLRDFRGDTVHPSTLAIIDELGLRQPFDKLPQHRVTQLSGIVGGRVQQLIDFRGLQPYAYLALVPQWDFLDMLVAEARRYPTFDLRMRHKATGLIEENGRVAGVQVDSPDGPLQIRADLVVACDGRHSTLRDASGLQAMEFGAPMDVLWFRMPQAEGDPADAFGIIDHGHMMVLLNRTTYWQVAFLVPKGQDATLRAQPVDVLQDAVVQLAPFFAERKSAIDSWDRVSTLAVQVDRLLRWHRPGMLLIGDAAHAMSPIGGVGINLAIQDAVAAANALTAPLHADGAIAETPLAQIQRRREWPVRVVQHVQLFAQDRMIKRVLSTAGERPHVPAFLRWLLRFRVVRQIPARLFGYGIRQEHVRVGPHDPAAG